MEKFEFSFLNTYHEHSESHTPLISRHTFDLVKDFLSIDVSYEFFAEYASNDASVLSQRYDLMRDMMADVEVYEHFLGTSVDLLSELCIIDEIKASVGEDIEDQLLHSKILVSYVLWIEKSYELLIAMDEKRVLRSLSMQEYFSFIRLEYENPEFKKLAKNARHLETSISNIKSITLGINLNPDFSVREAGIMSINEEPVKSGNLIDKILRGDLLQMAELQALMPLVKVPHSLKQQELIAFNQTVHQALGRVFKKSLGNWSHHISRLYMTKASQFAHLLPEMKFLYACLLFIKRMRKMEAAVCLPQALSPTQNICRLEGMYLPSLIDITNAKPIANDIELCKGEIHLLYGPNHGGKTKLLQCLLNIYTLYHLGAPLPATHATLAPVSGIVYYSIDQKAINGNAESRLLSELKEIKRVFATLRGGEFVVCDEMFSSTQEIEGSQLAVEVIRAFRTYEVYFIYSTHLHNLCETLLDKISDVKVSHMTADQGKPTYHLQTGVGPANSYAQRLATENGVSFDMLKNKNPQ